MGVAHPEEQLQHLRRLAPRGRWPPPPRPPGGGRRAGAGWGRTSLPDPGGWPAPPGQKRSPASWSSGRFCGLRVPARRPPGQRSAESTSVVVSLTAPLKIIRRVPPFSTGTPFFTQNLTRNSLHDRSCQDAREKTRWQVIWLHAQQTWEHRPSTRAVSQATGFSQNWVYKLIRRYNAEGAQGLIDKHRHNPGGDERASLNQEEQQALRRALPARPPDGGCGRPARWPPGFRRTPASAWPGSPPGPTRAAWVSASNAPATPALRARRLSKKVAQVVPSGSCTRISRWGSGARMRPGWA